MNRRLRGCAACMLVLGMWGLAAQAQPAAKAKPNTLALGAYGNPSAARADIDAFVKVNVDEMLNDADPAAQSKARKALEDASYEKPATPASAAFFLEYSQSLNTAFFPKLGPKVKTSLRNRLNIGIVTARVAAIGQNSSLAPTVERLITDGAEPVILWGLKAAQPLVPDVVKLKLPGGQLLHPMIASISPAVLKHPSGPIFDEAYTALGSVAGVADMKLADKPAYTAVMTELIALWDNRLQQYRKDIPEDPAVDAKPVFFLTRETMWKTLITEKKTQLLVMQMLSDQLGMAAQYADSIIDRKDQDKRDQLIKLSAQCCGGAYVVGAHQNIQKLMNESKAGSQLNPTILPWGTKIRPETDPVVAEIARSFDGVKAPPTVGSNAGAGVARP